MTDKEKKEDLVHKVEEKPIIEKIEEEPVVKEKFADAEIRKEGNIDPALL